MTKVELFYSHVDIKGLFDCWEWTAHRNQNGYGRFRINSIRWSAHRLAWFLVHGAIPEGIEVLHKCDNRACCNPAHLFLGTQKDNMDDMILKGRKAIIYGSKHANAKLNEDDILKIKRLYGLGYRKCELAKQYNVTDGAIAHIVDGRSWLHVQKPPQDLIVLCEDCHKLFHFGKDGVANAE